MQMPSKKVLFAVMPDDYRYGHVLGYTEKQMIDFARDFAAEKTVKLEIDRRELMEALKEAVAWIEDDRCDDEYIMEEWYHMATEALQEDRDE